MKNILREVSKIKKKGRPPAMSSNIKYACLTEEVNGYSVCFTVTGYHDGHLVRDYNVSDFFSTWNHDDARKEAESRFRELELSIQPEPLAVVTEAPVVIPVPELTTKPIAELNTADWVEAPNGQ